ncbi:GDP/GTP exchange factor for ARF [Malassezia yamatoensis]|uniref:GDP/GTP exchange factor for ARF n=1 Tax=Malassezia yamatoensis TaxID=253288 RepID=A0AAJ5YTA4_9BASI|nr:GDP/GTP exchange factor for ARF [Malassezia yamatoensis]
MGSSGRESYAPGKHGRRDALMHLVVREINCVTSAMRSSPRWAHAGTGSTAFLSSATTGTSALSLTRAAYTLAQGDAQEHAAETKTDTHVGLLGGFTVLRAQLRLVDDVTQIPLPTVLSHFLLVITSPRTTGNVTQTVLEALARFLQHGLFREESIGLVRAVQDVSHALSHCRFEPSDTAKDESVLLSILEVMEQLVSGRAFSETQHNGPRLVELLGDQNICEMMETCLSMCCQTRLTPALRRSAEQHMLHMSRTLYDQLHWLPLNSDKAYATDVAAQQPELATLTANQVGDDKAHRTRMTMPDPKSSHVPAAGIGSEIPPSKEPSLTDSQTLHSEQENEREHPSEQVHLNEQGNEQTQEKEREQEPPNSNASPITPNDNVESDTSNKLAIRDEPDHHLNVEKEPSSEATPSSKAEPSSDTAETQNPAEVPESNEVGPIEDQPPFGLLALVEVLRVLVSLLDLQSVRHTMTMRLLGLRVLSGLLETHGEVMVKFPTLRALLQDSACRYLFQLVNSEHLQLVRESLRMLNILMDDVRGSFKLQQELFVLFLLQQLRSATPLTQEPWHEDAPKHGLITLPYFQTCASGELRELYMESLSLLLHRSSKHSDAYVELWRNYDCDVECADLYEELVQFLCRTIFSQPSQAASERSRSGMNGLQLVCLDQILELIARMSERYEASNKNDLLDSTLKPLLGKRARKQRLAAGAAAFNAKPKEGIAFLEREKMIDTSSEEVRAKTLAQFLKASSLVDKRLLGDYISRPENVAVLCAFLDLFDFQGTDVAEAMRAVCEAFRFPGEAQQIARITESFSHAYYMSKPAGIHSEDAVYVLAYSIIMLNTDLHNPQVTRRMSIADYQKNLRGVNDGQDFDPEYLANVYESIRRREIVMPEEHAGQLGFEYGWKELLLKSRSHHTLVCEVRSAWDRALFQQSWQPFVASIAHAFTALHDEHLLQRVIAGCRQCAVLARAYDVPNVFDYMIQHFAQATGLPDSSLAQDTASNTEYSLNEKETIIISPLAVEFGTNFKSQLAAVVLFTIANGSPSAIRQGWTSILAVLESLLRNGLLPTDVMQMYDPSVGASVKIPRVMPNSKYASMASNAGGGGGGLFSTLSSYFLSPYADSPEPMEVGEAQIESSLCSLDCLASCKIAELHSQLKKVPDPCLQAYLDALHTRLAFHLSQETPTDPKTSASVPMRLPTNYSPVTLFLMEELTTHVVRRTSIIGTQAPRVLTQFFLILKQPKERPIAEVQRAFVNAMRVVSAMMKWKQGNASEAFSEILTFALEVSESMHEDLAVTILSSLHDTLQHQPALLPTQSSWQKLAQMVNIYARPKRRESACIAFALAEYHLLHSCTALNYAALVELARELISNTDRALWVAARQPRDASKISKGQLQSLTDWEQGVQSSTLALLSAMEQVKERIPKLLANETSNGNAWAQYWLPLIAALAQQCVNASRATRQAAVAHLQRVVLGPAMLQHAPQPLAPELEAMFQNIVFPLLDTLLQPDTLRADSRAFGEGASIPTMRLHVALLLCRAWVQYQTPLSQDMKQDQDAARRFERVWLGVLGYVARLLPMSQPPAEKEAIQEQTKNMLLVMHAAQLLRQREIWDATWNLLEKPAPELRLLIEKREQDAQVSGCQAVGNESNLATEALQPHAHPTDLHDNRATTSEPDSGADRINELAEK